MGRYITTTGTASTVIRNIDSNYSAIVNDRILLDSSGGSFTITLPINAELLVGDQIQIIDVGNLLAANNVVLDRNGSLILGAADNLTLDISGTILTLLFTGNTYGWVISST
jgi:hypothetical protein